MPSAFREQVVRGAAVFLCLFTLVEVNYPHLAPQSQLAIFAMIGMALSFLLFPARKDWKDSRVARAIDMVLLAVACICCCYVVSQNEPMFQNWWLDGRSLGNRAGAEVFVDFLIGAIGVAVVLEVTRRAVGMPLPVLATMFLLYAAFGSHMPDWLFPHRGYALDRIVAQTFLHSQGVFGIALKVMFSYVFLFVVFGALLEATGAIQFVIGMTRRLFRGSAGGASKVAVIASGFMGSLSGSAVANAATTGTFTIPLMKSSGFPPHIAAGITAAASSGGALVPPVMGAGAYMMLEIIDPPVTYLQIMKAAILPAVLFYLALFLIVHFYSRRVGASVGTEGTTGAVGTEETTKDYRFQFEGVVFFAALGALIVFLIAGFTVFRAVTLAIGVVLVLSSCHPRTRIGWKSLLTAMVGAARGGIALITASACVGIILGVVTLTGVGTKFPAAILALSGESLLLALVLIMVGSIVLGMGLPSAVCYLLMATLIGSVLNRMDVIPLAAHLFIFYFGMMSMVTPPVALAAYTSGSIAGTNIMRSSLAAFRFALVGFTLPFMFVFRPELLLMGPDGGAPSLSATAMVVGLALLGIFALAVGIAGFLWAPLSLWPRAAFLTVAALLLYPGATLINAAGVVLLVVVVGLEWRTKSSSHHKTIVPSSR